MARLEKIRVRHPFPAIQIMFHMELRARDRARAQSQEPGWLMRDHGGFPFEKPGMVGRSRLRAGLSPHREYRAVVRAALNHHQPVYQRADVQAFEKRTHSAISVTDPSLLITDSAAHSRGVRVRRLTKATSNSRSAGPNHSRKRCSKGCWRSLPM